MGRRKLRMENNEKKRTNYFTGDEAKNTRIQRIKKIASGLHNKERFKKGILFHYLFLIQGSGFILGMQKFMTLV